MVQVAWYPHTPVIDFPPFSQALSDPDGLLLMGGDLSQTSLQNAYSSGIFPWFSEGDPIMWWSPSERAVIDTNHVHISKNMRKLLKQPRYHVEIDCDFETVIRHCAFHKGRESTWITEEMQAAYCHLHHVGLAHSVAVYDKDNQLVGGLYGVFVKNIFCGESMFSLQPNTSKLALIHLSQFLSAHGCDKIDCQIPTLHLSRMGAKVLERADFINKLQNMNNNEKLNNCHWRSLWRHYSA